MCANIRKYLEIDEIIRRNLHIWTTTKPFPSICPEIEQLSTQVEEELAKFLGII